MKDKYDLSSPEAIAASAKLARERAAQEPDQSSYNAAWLHGCADALADAARQLEAQQCYTPKKQKRKDFRHER